MRLPRLASTRLAKSLLPISLFVFSSLPAFAHELWLEAFEYQIEVQGRLVANIVNGQNFQGHRLPYLPAVAIRFDLVTGGEAQPIVARAGDRPALDFELAVEGLNVVVYQARNATLTYSEWEKFGNFIEHKDLPTSRDTHLARGLPDAGFKEVYSRYSKALIGVGHAQGTDLYMGLDTEIVALDNPYLIDPTQGLRVQLFYQGEARVDEQIEVFAKDMDGVVSTTTTRTGTDGVALISIEAGHSYMLDAVVLREPSSDLAQETGAVWESLWANLTFGVPAAE